MNSKLLRQVFLRTTDSTIVDILRWRATNQSSRIAYTFLTERETKENNLTYEELDRRARAIGEFLLHDQIKPRAVLLLLPSGLEYIAAFFGCLYAGIVAIPGFPIRTGSARWGEPWFRAIARDACPSIALVELRSIEKLRREFQKDLTTAGIRLASVQDVDIEMADEWKHPVLNSESLAFVQYTSGSTSLPKGVMVSHGNIMHNQRAIQTAYGQSETSIVASWLPLQHDMGLIGSVLQPAFLGARSVLLSPSRFLQSPLSWLRAISMYRGTSSSAPNFGYDICSRRITSQEKEGLDLTSWTIAVNGAEPVRYETMERFANVFSDCGFRIEAFRPSYGLAEATLMITGARDSKLPLVMELSASAFEQHVIEPAKQGAPIKRVVGCGRPVLGNEIRVVNPETSKVLPDGSVGEICISGQSVTSGYWNRGRDNKKVSYTNLADGASTFLRTGDLGFMMDEQLFVTGRLKDLIIIHGCTFYPQDIEGTVLRTRAEVGFGCAVAFTVEVLNEERVVVISEAEHHEDYSPDRAIDRIYYAVALEHGIAAHRIILVKRGTLPKTTSGKVKRSTCREALILRKLDVVASKIYPAPSEVLTQSDGRPTRGLLVSVAPDIRQEIVENYLRIQVGRILRVTSEAIPTDKPLIAIGVDSVGAFELIASLRDGVEFTCNPMDLLQECSLSELANRIVNYLVSSKANGVSSEIEKSEAETEFSLSYGQEALWVLYKLAPQSAAYNLAGAARTKSEISLPALRLAFKGVMDEHGALRTTFDTREGNPVQLVRRASDVNVDLHFEVRDGSQNTQSLLECLNEEARRPFVLERAPPVRLVVYRQSPTEYVLLLVMHHIIADFWSMSQILHSLGRLYSTQISGGNGLIRPGKTVTYREFVSWQRAKVDSSEGDEVGEFWKLQLSPAVPTFQLAQKAKRPVAPSDRGAAESVRFDRDFYHGLEILGRELRITPFLILLAGFQLLLHRLSGLGDLAVAVPTNGRTDFRFSNTVGYFVNPIPVRSKYEGSQTVLSFLEDTRRTALNALRHAEYPFKLIVEKTHPQRLPGISPICQTMFVWQKESVDDCDGLAALSVGEGGAVLDLDGLLLESIRLEPTGSQFELTLMMTVTSNGLLGSFKYNPDVHDPDEIRLIAVQFSRFLEAIVKNPQQQLDSLPLAGETGGEYTPRWLHSTASTSVPDRCVYELFEEQVVRDPGSTALIVRQTKLTFAQLNSRANQFAHYLRKLGVACECRVGLFLERSVELIVALLGIWKAGAAYVPMDTTDPKMRNAGLLEQSSIDVLITHERLLDRLPDQLPQTVLLDLDLDLIAEEKSDNLGLRVPMESAAYVIYTSGSTGQPKGVIVEHGSLVNLLKGLRGAVYSQLKCDKLIVGLNAPLSFDASVKQFIMLALGHTLCLLPDEIRRNGHALHECMKENGLHILDCTPSQVQLLIETGFGSTSNSVSLLVGGEAISNAMWDSLAKTGPARCFNLYGPTECTVDATFCPIQVGEEPSIGRPLSGTRVLLLDEDLCPVPVGTSGEIFIGGPSLARGYLRRPELTAEKFVPDPFCSENGGRLYRTGDRAKWLPDGTLKIIGRVDRQVKIRGFRVELEEVEAVLREHPGVSDAAVVFQEGSNGVKQLFGYVVPIESSNSHQYRRFLAQRLPDYMVPSAILTLNEIPTSTNGKKNYSALPVPEMIEIERGDDFAPPCCDLESVLVKMWSDTLHTQPIGIHDNFFALGGDSLQATRLITRIEDKFQSAVPLLALFFQDPTIAALAKVLSTTASLEAPSFPEDSNRDGAQLGNSSE